MQPHEWKGAKLDAELEEGRRKARLQQKIDGKN